MADFLSGPWISFAVALLLTALVAAESRWLPWSPFFHVYALLALAIPFLAGGWAWGSLSLWRDHGYLIAATAAVMIAWELGAAAWFYERVVLRWLGKSHDASWSPSLALDWLVQEVIRKTGRGASAVQGIYGAYSLVWAPLAEELFYWGYLYGNLRRGLPFWAAAAATSLLFGVRHATHFLYLGRRYPAAAAAWLALSTAFTGLLNSWLYERIEALSPLIAIHFAVNILFTAYAASLPVPAKVRQGS